MQVVPAAAGIAQEVVNGGLRIYNPLQLSSNQSFSSLQCAVCVVTVKAIYVTSRW